MSSTILVVDSDDRIRALINDLLEPTGHLVEGVSTLAEGTAFLTRTEPDLVFLCPDVDEGMELRAMAAREDMTTTFILLVDRSLDHPAKVVREFDCLTYLRKPVDPNRLQMALTQGLDVREAQLQQRELTRQVSRMQDYIHTALDSDGGAFFFLDEQGNIQDSGGDMLPFMDVQSNGLEQVPYLSILPAATARLHEQSLARVRNSLIPVRLREERGGTVSEAWFKPVLSQGELTGFVIRFEDITAKERDFEGLAGYEKQYRSVFEGSREAVVILDRRSGQLLEGNSAACRVLGYSMEELSGLALPEIVEHPSRTMQAMVNGVTRVAYEYFKRKDGSSFPVELSLSYFTNDGRELCAMYAQDISRRQIVEEALKEGARLYRAVVEDQTELICRYDPTGKLTFINSAYARFFGDDEDEAVGHDSFHYLNDADRRVLESWLKRVGADEPVLDQEFCQVRHDGERRWIHWTNRAVFNERHEVTEIQAVGRDVTDRKAAEQALLQANQEKEQYRLNLVATFRSIPDAILTVDSELTIMASNAAAATLLSYDRGRMRGLSLTELDLGQGNPCVSVLKQVIRTSKPVRGYEIELETPGLGVRMVEINCSPLIGQEERQTGAVLIVRDVSHIVDLEKQLQQRQGFRGIVGQSTAMQDIYQLLEQLSSLDSTVLILGESGTGKELVAEALHYGGARAGHSLVKVNCSALSESLLESELFGHVRGAFTGAVRDKKGRIQAAQGGTLFLDEIGDISPLIQLKLLRFLEQKEYERVGESKTHSADVRIIAATNVNLMESVRQGAFREDLYYRLNVMPVTLPALRERQSDIPLLVNHFLSLFAEQFGKPFEAVAPEVMDLFMTYRWPGNVRELRHSLEHACILATGNVIGTEHLRKDLLVQMHESSRPVPVSVTAEPERTFVPARKPGRDAVLAVLEQCGGNKVRAAKELGIHRATLYRKLKAWGVEM